MSFDARLLAGVGALVTVAGRAAVVRVDHGTLRGRPAAGRQSDTVRPDADVPRREIGRCDRLSEVRAIGGVGDAEAKHKRDGCTELRLQ